MKKIIFGCSLLLVSILHAQTASSIIGTWSFDKIDTSSLSDGLNEDSVPMLATMFGSFEITFDGSIYNLSMMSAKESGAYNYANKKITLKDGTIITFLSDASATVAAGDIVFFIKPGAYVKEVVSMEFLTQDTYENIVINTDLISQKWQVKEVRSNQDNEEAEMIAALVKLMSFDFKKDGTFNLSIAGVGEDTTWQLGEEKGELLVSMGDNNSNVFFVKQLTKDSMIIEMKENEVLIYLIPMKA